MRSSCSSATPTRRRSPPRSSSWSPTGSPAGIAAQDATLWGPAAEDEAGKRLAWVDLSETSPAAGRRDRRAARSSCASAGLTRVVLCGMGGSSLAPEVICGAAGVELDVLDSSDPDFVRAALEDRLAETVVVVSSKSGGTVETDSQRRAFEKAFADAGIDPRRADRRGHRPRLAARPVGHARRATGCSCADPDVGGRYSALTAFGLVPSGLAGADIARAARRGRGDPRRPRGRLRRQPRPAPRRPARRRQPGRRRQAGAGRRRARRTPASATGPSS